MNRMVGVTAVAAVLFSLAGTATPTSGSSDITVWVEPTGLVETTEISHDGSTLLGNSLESDQLVIGQRGTYTAVASENDYIGFVRDNPVLSLTRRSVGDIEAVYLTNSATKRQWRIDTDSRGVALKPSWQSHCDDECGEVDVPGVFISPESISRNGRKAAFCSNYKKPDVPQLYVKDLKSGRLTRTSQRCGLYWNYLVSVQDPAISDDGRVVHLTGTEWPDDSIESANWLADTLYFTATGKSRKLNGSGSMTRDGGTVFMRIGVHPQGTPDLTAGGVSGAYNVKTKATVNLPGSGDIYGNNALRFSAFDQASRAGRFVTNQTSVIDRKTGMAYDLNAVLASKGLQPFTGDDADDDDDRARYASAMKRISGDGKSVIAPTGTPYVGDIGNVAWSNRHDVMITDWAPAGD